MQISFDSTALGPPPKNPPLSKAREAFMAGLILTSDRRDRTFSYQSEVMKAAAQAGLLVEAGHLPDSVVRTIGQRGAELAFDRVFDHPWGERPWLLTHTWSPDDETGRMFPDDPATLFAQSVPPEKRLALARCYYLVEPSSTPDHFGAIVTEYLAMTLRGYTPLAFIPTVRCTLTHTDRDTFRTQVEGPPEFRTPGGASSALNPVMTTLMLMNTRGVRHSEHVPPTTKQVRRKGGYVRLESAEYVTALTGRGTGAAGAGDGSRRSPIPHIRRGHTRHLPDGRTTWVRDMLVNCVSEGEMAFAERHRAAYRVRGDTDAR